MSNLRFQKRLAASVLDCGLNRVWLDNSETSSIAVANARSAIRKLVHNGIIVKKHEGMHSSARHKKRLLAKREGRHTGYGKRRGSKNARTPEKFLWIRRIRCLRKTLREHRNANSIDRQSYRKLYLKAKGNMFRNKRVLEEHISRLKDERRQDESQKKSIDAKRERARRRRNKKQGALV